MLSNRRKTSKIDTTRQTPNLLQLLSEEAVFLSVTFLIACAQNRFFSIFDLGLGFTQQPFEINSKQWKLVQQSGRCCELCM